MYSSSSSIWTKKPKTLYLIGSFFYAVPVEDTIEAYEEEVLPAGVVTEDETATIDENLIAKTTVDADKKNYMANNLPSVDDVPHDHFIPQDYLDNMKVIDF